MIFFVLGPPPGFPTMGPPQGYPHTGAPPPSQNQGVAPPPGFRPLDSSRAPPRQSPLEEGKEDFSCKIFQVFWLFCPVKKTF